MLAKTIRYPLDCKAVFFFLSCMEGAKGRKRDIRREAREPYTSLGFWAERQQSINFFRCSDILFATVARKVCMISM